MDQDLEIRVYSIKTRKIYLSCVKAFVAYFNLPPVTGPEQVLGYLGRYIQRTAISNHRILAYDGTDVEFKYRDRRDGNRSKTMTLAAPEFLRRMLLHVLPKGFTRIRHYGFLANCKRENAITVAREQLGAQAQAIRLRFLRHSSPLMPATSRIAKGSGAVEFKRRLATAEGMWITSPEYNHSVPGTFKNTIDWASRGTDDVFAGKVATLSAISPGLVGGMRMLPHLRQVLTALGV